MPVQTIRWVGGLDGHVEMIDQTLLPGQHCIIKCGDVECMWDAIKKLRVRGAPAIGIAAAFGVLLGIQSNRAHSLDEFRADLARVTDYLATARPTAVNLFWALARMRETVVSLPQSSAEEARNLLFREAMTIWEEDKSICRRIGENGAGLIADGDGILTHCNAGGLATADYGTALAVLFRAAEQGRAFHVYADETRPLLQGARLTTWELMHAGIDVTLICDNMAALVMEQGRVNKVLVGADRIAANGDTANKIGTYGVAVLARHHGIPFYVAAPESTFDLTLTDGSEIPIEERSAEEVTEGFGSRTAPEGVKVYNPAFDVTPAELITAIITEKGVIEQPAGDRIGGVLGRRG